MDDPSAPSSGAAPTSTPAPAPAETVLTSLHTLLRAHVASHPNPSPPYLHPFAPLPPAAWKGKARAALPSAEGQVALLRRIREAVEASRGVLGRREEERTRLARSMREVITHESALLPLGTTLLSLPPAPRPLAHLCLLPPSDLLSSLGRRLDLQVFAEDSQFGLLRTSLTLAGSRFVVDVDLEADSIGDESEPPTAAGTPAFPPLTPLTPFGAAPTVQDANRERLTGKMRLAKLSANHVTPSGEDGKSEWVAKVLRELFEAHLVKWNEYKAKEEVDEQLAQEELLPSARALEAALAEVKALDELAEVAAKGDADLFADLEVLAAKLGDVEGIEVVEGLFPSFRVVRGGPVFRFRPQRRGETVPPARIMRRDIAQDGNEPGDVEMNGAGAEATGDDTMILDGGTMDDVALGDIADIAEAVSGVVGGAPGVPDAGLAMIAPDEPVKGAGGAAGSAPVEEAPEPMCRGRWLVEVDDSGRASGSGIVVRRTWLLSDAPEEKEEGWSSSFRVEGLIYASQLPTEGPPHFPYGTDFVHPTPGGLAQHWSLAQAGPEGYLVGRVGLPSSWEEFGDLVAVLRAQVVLDVLFASVFTPGALRSEEDDDGDEDMTLDDLDQPPTAIPLTVSLQQRSMRVYLPLPGVDGDSPPTLTLEFRPSDEAPYVALSYGAEGLSEEQRGRVDAAVSAAVEEVDAVKTVRRLLAAVA